MRTNAMRCDRFIRIKDQWLNGNFIAYERSEVPNIRKFSAEKYSGFIVNAFAGVWGKKGENHDLAWILKTSQCLEFSAFVQKANH